MYKICAKKRAEITYNIMLLEILWVNFAQEKQSGGLALPNVDTFEVLVK